ncbi:M16 family metallopeptidase [Tahibacter amnicola]|uniref:Insulinase family protein n=1 Tax=Tahibacter amnicola TaxID=2976241 RepID=A0ABY6BGK5_9GAMM|nr:pitrilysin family protein [Tahibacter amnicola]UXI68443.1 insulinase family protein [Tahibacter amnicola]
MRNTLAFAIGAVLSIATAFAAPTDTIDIPFEKFELPNGLTVVVHEDRKAPVVAVSVWYHVGSKDEKAGKTGFAHLFEHLMFQASENHKDEYFRPFELVGATDMNGTTWLDRTNYFQTVPTTAVDMALWMESDRMGHLLGAVDQKTLDEQRGVVQNEKRQGENEPYGRVWERLQMASFPEGHPYRWETIGSMEDLNAASLDDVKQWFRDYYGAANTTIVLAGDIDAKTAREKMQKYFGDIPAGPPIARRKAWVAARTESTRDHMLDQVAQTRIYRSWNVPQRGTAELTHLQLAAAVLGGSKTSRLYERLVFKDRIADTVDVSVEPFELASLFGLQVDVKSGVEPQRVEQVIAEEWQRFLDKGPTQEELDRVRTAARAGFVRALEKVGGSGKAQVLAESQVYLDDPAAFKRALARMDAATIQDVHAAARQWISKGDYTLQVDPYPAHQTTPSTVDRSKGVPRVTEFPDLAFPAIERGKLKNGIEVVLARRATVPIVQLSMQFHGGYASDKGRKLGTSSFTMGMLDEGTKTLGALDIARRQEELGAAIGAGAGLDNAAVSLNALKSQLKPSLALFADVVRNPGFKEADLERLRGQWLAGIAQEKTEPQSLALRVLPPLVYGEGHPYAIPLTGSGTEASVKALTRADLESWHREYLRPENARILVAGDTTLEEITRELDVVFGDWTVPGTPASKNVIDTVSLQPRPRVYLMDKPGAQQSMILAGEAAPSSRAPNYLEIGTMNSAFGGSFTSRLNMNLREDKHWAYGAGSFLGTAEGQRLFILYAPVQTDKTAESVAEMQREVREVVGKRPLTKEEIEKIKVSDTRELPGRFETIGAVLGAVTDIVRFNRPDDYVQTLKARVEAQDEAAIHAATREVIKPDALTWVIVGDLSKIEAPVRALNIGEVKVIDAEGKVQR